MHVGDHHGALADGGGDALRRAGARIPDGVDAGNARTQQMLAACTGAGEDEAVLVALDRVAEPVRVRVRTEEEKQVGEGDALAILERDRLELAVASVQLGDLASIPDLDPISIEIADQVAGHGLAQVSAPVEQRHQRPAAGQPDRSLGS